jgi:hypothetical protein
MEAWREVEQKVVPLLERLVEANEAIVRMADEENSVSPESPPPFCPHCHQLDPVVKIEVSGNGLLSGFVMEVLCHNCDRDFYAAPVGWFCAATTTDVETFLGGGDDGGG